MIPALNRRGLGMRRFVQGADRGQSTLLPECLDDWVADDNPARVIDAFVAALDLAELGFGGVEPAGTGRPSYHPAGLLRLYIYGYLNRVHSSRRLEREAGRNVEVMWLLARLAPDHKTIADFRKDNGPGIKKVCARFVEVCRKMGLLATASVAIDGSKFKAVNNRDKNFTRAKVERRRAQLEESVARYLSQLDTADRQEPTEALAAKVTRLTEKLTKLKEEMGKLAVYEKEMRASPDQQISLTDPDSRSMATSGRGSGVVGYNVQVAVDTEHHLIVTHEVTNTGSDRSQLAKVALQAKDILGADHLDAVARRMLAAAQERREFAALGLAEFDAVAYIHLCLLAVRGTNERLNRMSGVWRPQKVSRPSRASIWRSSTHTRACTAGRRPKPTCSNISGSAHLQFTRWCSRSNGQGSFGDNRGSLATSKSSLIRSTCQFYADPQINPSKPLC